MHGSLLLHSRPPSAPAIRQGVACIIPTVVAVCLRRLSRRLAKARPPRLHGPARQSLRQRQDRELHEDTQGRSRVSDGVRNLRGRYSRPSPLHRRGLQHSQTPLRARLSEPGAIRGSPRPATCQNRRLKLSTIKGALQCAVFMKIEEPESSLTKLNGVCQHGLEDRRQITKGTRNDAQNLSGSSLLLQRLAQLVQ